MKDIKINIEKLAKAIGFDAIGFAKASPLIKDIQHLTKWLEMGYNAQMKFFEKTLEKRQNVNKILDNANTVIMLAVNYYNCEEYNRDINKNLEGKIARYAWSMDYHIVIMNMLNKLVQKITEIYPLAKCCCYVDTGPVMEKRWAEIAGIGWQGKNSLIISKEFGSWIFLGTIITNLIVEPDQAAENHCGTCNICIEQCPTKAISEFGAIDARKCISYWTIEDKSGSIPENILNNLNGWAFGCDICQEVCPWNKYAKQTNNPDFASVRTTKLSYLEILQISKEEYNKKYKDSPLGHKKHKHFKKLIENLMINK